MATILSAVTRRIGWAVFSACLVMSIASASYAQPAPQSPPAEAPAPQPAPPPAPPAPAPVQVGAGDLDEPPPVSQETKEQAKDHFLRGIKLLREEAWAPALAEFLLSRELFATRVATNNAAVALRKLQRYDESLDMWETLLRDFKVNQAQQEEAQREVAELRSLVGTIDVTGAEPGATIVVDSVDRGQYPPVKPIRVAAGSHVVRVFKEGFNPYETRVDVAGGKTAFVEAPLQKLADSGTLRVTERSGRKLNVMVDSVIVGSTPWQGKLGVGDHMVSLSGVGKLGTQPVNADVKSQQVTTLALLAEELDSQLRVNPVPAGASVWINGVNVGNGVWLGRLKSGKHKIEVKKEGFLTSGQDLALAVGQRKVLEISLERDDDAPQWRKPSKWTVDAAAGVVIGPSLGGAPADGCGGGCSNPIGLGGFALVHGGYELGSGLGFGIEAGYLIVNKSVNGRAGTVLPTGLSSPDEGLANDVMRLQGLVAAATIGYHFEGNVPVTVRTGAGIFYGELRDERDGTFTTRAGDSFDAFSLVDFPTATYFYIDPTARVGFRFLETFELAASVRALLLVGLSQPKWDGSLQVAAGSDGIATYPGEALMGSFVILPAVGLDLRSEF